MASGLGYNPYRDAEGKFSRPGDVGAKVEGDLEAAYAAGDVSKAEAIEQFAMERMPESRLGRSLLEKSYGIAPVQKRNPLSEHELQLRAKNVELAKRIVELRAENGDVTFDDADPERAKRRLAEALEFAEGRGNTNLVGKLSSAKVLPSGAFQRKSDKKRVNTDAALKAYVAEKEIEEGRELIQRAIQTRIDRGEITEGKYVHRDDSGTYSLTVAPAIDQIAYENLDERTKAAISSPRESLSIELAREKLTDEQLKAITNDQQVMDFVVGKKPEITGIPKPGTHFTGKDSDETAVNGLKSLSSYTQGVERSFGSKSDRAAVKAENAEIIKSAVANREENTFVPGRAYANGALLSSRRVLVRKAVEETLTVAQMRSITATTLQPDPAKARRVLTPEQYSAIFERQTATMRVTPKRKK